MKRKSMVIMVLVLMISFSTVKGATFNDYLPGGKNYLGEYNLRVSNDRMSTLNPFLVKDNTTYTISFPGTGMIGENLYVEIVGNDLYFDGNVENNSSCSMGEQGSWCTFTTVNNEDYIDVAIDSDSISSYYNYYGMYGFQLEEGSSPTSYEEYIIPLIDIEEPFFSGIGAYIKSYNTFESIEDIINNHIAVIDEVDGDITNSIVIESNDYTGNEQIVGEYLVELSSTDSSGNTAYFSLSVLVKDEIPPSIVGPNEISISIDDVESINSIISNNFTINDDYSDTSLSIVSNEYTPNNDELGHYKVKFKVVDEALNSRTVSFYLNLIDIDSPTISSDLNITSLLSNPMNTDSILNGLAINDNYDDLTSSNINVITNQFSGNEEIPGIYIISFELSDLSSNSIVGNLTITVVDDLSPVISGPVSYQGSYEEGLLSDDFIDMLTVVDNIDSIGIDDLYIIEDTYSNRSSIIGDYEIIFGIIDSNDNETIHKINITLFDDIAPIVYIDEFVVSVDTNSSFTHEDALLLLINSNELTEGEYTIRTLMDGYTGNEKTEGTYVYLLDFVNDEGESYEKEFLVKVIDDNKDHSKRNLLIRNIIIYSTTVISFGFIIYKNKK